MASFKLDSTGKIFFSTSSMGPGLCAIFSLRSSASLALFSFSCLAWREGSAEVSIVGEKGAQKDGRTVLVLPRDLQCSRSRHGRVKCMPRQSRVSWLPVPQHEGQARPGQPRGESSCTARGTPDKGQLLLHLGLGH